MAQKITLRVEFDDAQAKAGMNNFIRTMQEGGAKVMGLPQPGSLTGGGKDDSAGATAERGAKSFLAAQAAGVISNVGNSVVQMFDPMKTAFQKQEAARTSGVDMAGAGIGAGIGAAIAGPFGAIAGKEIGQAVAGVINKAIDLANQKTAAVDQSVSQTMQGEAALRARMGLPFNDEEFRKIAAAEKAGAAREYDFKQRAVNIGSQVMGDNQSERLLTNAGLIRGRNADAGGGFAMRDALSQVTFDRN